MLTPVSFVVSLALSKQLTRAQAGSTLPELCKLHNLKHYFKIEIRHHLDQRPPRLNELLETARRRLLTDCRTMSFKRSYVTAKS